MKQVTIVVHDPDDRTDEDWTYMMNDVFEEDGVVVITVDQEEVA